MIKKTINIKIPEDKEECEKINCLECGLLNTDFCQEIMQAINKKVDKDSLEEQIEKLKKRVEELERTHIYTHSAPPITQPFPWTPAGPIYCVDVISDGAPTTMATSTNEKVKEGTIKSVGTLKTKVNQ